MLTIQGRSLGSKRPLFADWSIPIPPEVGEGGDGMTLRRLIEGVVRAEVAAFRTRAEARRVDRVFSRDDIAKGAAKGKVAPGATETPAEVDEAAAIEAALQAFEDGLYLVVVDAREIRRLDERIAVGPGSTVTFLRLTLLAGGF
ncbi:MAG: hypothetical protein R3B68_13400 [Phycisphaerales bacterium]